MNIFMSQQMTGTTGRAHYVIYLFTYSSLSHSPALYHQFVNGLGAPRRGRLNVTSFGLEPLNKLYGRQKKEGAMLIPFYTSAIEHIELAKQSY